MTAIYKNTCHTVPGNENACHKNCFIKCAEKNVYHTISTDESSVINCRNGKYPNTNGILTRNPVYSNHDSDKFNSMNDVRSAVANGAVIFGETREIKQAVACLNTQGSFGSSVSSGLNPDTNSDRFQRGDPYAASYPQATTLFRDDPSPTFSNPERESYV